MTTITPLPSAAMIELMNTAWSQTNINAASTAGTIGMYGSDDKYYFYMTFIASTADAWHTTPPTKKFRILF